MLSVTAVKPQSSAPTSKVANHSKISAICCSISPNKKLLKPTGL